MVRLVATDLDGTLLRLDGSVSGRTRAAIAGVLDAGIRFVMCTARPVRWVEPLAELVGGRGTAICMNGAAVWDFGAARAVREFPIPREVALEVVSRLRPLVPDGAWAVEYLRVVGREPAYRSRFPAPPGSRFGPIESLLEAATFKLLLRAPAELSSDELLELARPAVAGLVEVSHSSVTDPLLEISAAGVSKGSTLADLCHGAGIGAEEVIAFGDMPNDLSMLRWAGRPVAVANAHPDVIACAGSVTGSCDEDGVAAVLETLV